MKKLNAVETKKEFINSIYKVMMRMLKEQGNEEYAYCFQKTDTGIMCNLPSSMFSNMEIPDNTSIEIKFTTKRK